VGFCFYTGVFINRPPMTVIATVPRRASEITARSEARA
jgi:hypothetical protein